MCRNVEEKFLSGERAKEVTKERAGKVRLINAIIAIGDGVANTSAAVAVRKAAHNYCKQAMKRRNAIVVQHLDQKT